jgi:Fe-S-cluster-containing hydrogenase component 2
MNAVLRKVVHIDEQKCNGCGLCVPACAEGAIRIINGKARLIDDKFCDGLGACLGECPQGAITIEEREAAEFDEQAVTEHLHEAVRRETQQEAPFSGCPGSALRSFNREAPAAPGARPAGPSRLGHWPIQWRLVPPQAPFLQQADLLICADCVPFAFADFHQDFLPDKALVIGCPKLDDVHAFQQRLTQIFAQADINSITILYMEVPCCYGLVHAVKQALADSGKHIPLKEQVIGVKGDKL